MLRERLKSIDLRVTELADYLQLSRQTIYTYIQLYDNKQFGQINPNVLKLFNYITENDLAGKRNVVTYILNNIVEVKSMGENDDGETLKKIKDYLISNPHSKKSMFLQLCATGGQFDDVIYYLVDVAAIKDRPDKTPEDMQMLEPYKTLISQLKNLKKN
jgi:hypothetical protein